MAKITDQMNDFFRNKTIQRAYGFVVSFSIPRTNRTEEITRKYSSLSRFNELGDRFPINGYHVKNAVLPKNSYKREIQKWGTLSRTFPVYETDGLELRLEMEEDSYSNISLFVEFLQKLIIDEYGFYQHPSTNRFNILLDVVDVNHNKIITYKYKESYFLNSTEATFDYSTNEPLSYTITFGTDLYEIQVHDKRLRRLI
jgi:hypothetical protein